MAINIDGLTAAGALDPNDLMELQQAGVNKKLELGDLWVIAKGLNTLSIYKSATATTTIRPGNIHINDGTDDYIRESTSFSTVNISGATGWSFITCTQALAFTQRSATGAVTSRPTATCYTYVDGADTGYNHTKAGYYYSADERIIGAIYWDGSAIQYVINNLSGSDEIGQNSYGTWERVGKKQSCSYSFTTTPSTNSPNTFGSTSGNVYYDSDTWVYPVPYIATPAISGWSGSVSLSASAYPNTTQVGFQTWFAVSGTSVTNNVRAEGYWHL